MLFSRPPSTSHPAPRPDTQHLTPKPCCAIPPRHNSPLHNLARWRPGSMGVPTNSLMIRTFRLIFLSRFLPAGNDSAGSTISEQIVGALREPPASPRSGRRIVAQGVRTCEKMNNLTPSAQTRRSAKENSIVCLAVLCVLASWRELFLVFNQFFTPSPARGWGFYIFFAT